MQVYSKLHFQMVNFPYQTHLPKNKDRQIAYTNSARGFFKDPNKPTRHLKRFALITCDEIHAKALNRGHILEFTRTTPWDHKIKNRAGDSGQGTGSLPVLLSFIPRMQSAHIGIKKTSSSSSIISVNFQRNRSISNWDNQARNTEY